MFTSSEHGNPTEFEMTRNEFDATYAATQHNTEWFTDKDLEFMNDTVFAQVKNKQIIPEGAVFAEFEKACCKVRNDEFVYHTVPLQFR
jgi:hypothetical protein